jgi:hypothetical protein
VRSKLDESIACDQILHLREADVAVRKGSVPRSPLGAKSTNFHAGIENWSQIQVVLVVPSANAPASQSLRTWRGPFKECCADPFETAPMSGRQTESRQG